MTRAGSDSFSSFLDRRTEITNLCLVIGGTIALFIARSGLTATAFLVGGLLSWINHRWLTSAVDFVVARGAQERVARRVLIKYGGRYALIAVGLYVTIRHLQMEPVYLFLGLFAGVLAVLIQAICEIGKQLIEDTRHGRT